MTDGRSSGRILILGGTTEARLLAERLTTEGEEVVTSLAGRLSEPTTLPGEIRQGGFGGLDGLTTYLCKHQFAGVVDATHPFAEQIRSTAEEAGQRIGVPLLRLERPPWQAQTGDRWISAASLAEAASLTAQHGQRVLLAIGRQGVGAFAGVTGVWFLIRSIESPNGPLPPVHTMLTARGPFSLEDERGLLVQRQIDMIVTKNSGGPTDAKLTAARELGISVVMIDRPRRQPTAEVVHDVPSAVGWVRRLLGRE